MKNYNTLEGIERYYISNLKNKMVDGSGAWGKDVWYYTDIKVRNGFKAFAMVNINTFEYMLRCDPINDIQYKEYEKFCEEYNNPTWIQLS